MSLFLACASWKGNAGGQAVIITVVLADGGHRGPKSTSRPTE